MVDVQSLSEFSCPHCGTPVSAENYIVTCPGCGREGCCQGSISDYMPGGVACICPECESAAYDLEDAAADADDGTNTYGEDPLGGA